MNFFEEELEFEWDEGNTQNNLLKHHVSQDEVEDVFYNFNIILFDKKHLKTEIRLQLNGITDKKRILIVIFTIRNKKIRPISARDANKKEKEAYEKYQATQANSRI